MIYINKFKTFVLNEKTTKISPDRTSPSVWPSRLDDSPYWDILKSMGFTEKRIITHTGTFVIEAPDGQIYNLTKSGYLRVDPKYMLTYAGPQNIDGLFLFLIKRYLPSWKKKIGRNSNDNHLKILAKIQQLIDLEEKKLNLPNHPNLSAEQIKFLDLVCRDDNDVPSKWTYNNGEIDVKGDVILKNRIKHPSYTGIGSRPKKHEIKFGHIKGNFICDSLGLRSMEGKGFPHTVDGDFKCSYNQLLNLKGSPKKVGGSFVCEGSNLQSLEGAPQTIGLGFYCSYNQLQSLEGAPQTVDGDFSCRSNQLTSLQGAPQKVKGYFDCRVNPLQTLAGAPIEIGGEFSCSEFRITNNGGRNFFNLSEESFSSKWDLNGWIEVLKKGSPESQKLMATLPYITSNWFNKEFQRDPGKTVHWLAPIWKNLDPKVKAGIKIPPEYKDQFDLFSGFDELELF